ncbi:MAG TPA: radical SAM protein [Alphaproteobacteria bacterium]|jgi:pyruvate-formate lyase-activating enzyme|nr:radical SAM protein [Alphaproteobacteria bacterium]
MRDWSKADWVDPALNWRPLPVPDLPDRLLVDFATRCNLRCPMCPVWGLDDQSKIEPLEGVMALESARKMLDEFTTKKPMVAPSIYGEPLLIPNLREVLRDVKSRGMSLALNTNGLTLTESIAEFFCEIEVDSVMFSIDAVTPQTLKKVRSVDKLAKVESAVFRLMKVRGDREYPRVGVSFTSQTDNRHETEAFVRRWVGVVDVVRMGIVFEDGRFPDMVEPPERVPCPVIYKTMPVHHDGSVRLCCLDGLRDTDMGNVFKDGVRGVWHGEEFAKARYYHETGQWDKVPFCKGCNGWAQYEYSEEVVDGILIRRSPEYAYYNTINRLKNWKGSLLGGHKPPPADLQASAAE